MREKSSRSTLLTVVISILICATIGTSLLFWKEMNTLNNAYSDMNKIEFISSSTQRLISLAQSNSVMQRDIFFIGTSTEEALHLGTTETLSVLNNISMVLLATEVVNSWELIEELVTHDPVDFIDLGLARERHFKAMTDLSNEISDYTKELNTKITQYQAIILTLFFTIAMVMLNNILRTHTELKQSKALAQTAQIDMATGLYNRSRCQELFKSNQNPSNKKQPAILVLDLNDLKKTNDTLGHRVGDELIQSFANVLKSACDVHIVPPFIGRYGGDEFIVYYEDLQGEAELQIYLKELNFLTEQFNANEARFKISYAVGYSYISAGNDEKTSIRQLFDKADAAMYENKIAGKKAKNPDYEAPVDIGEVR